MMAKGLWILPEIRENKELDPLDCMLLSEIAHLEKNGGCFASNSFLAKECHVSLRKIVYALADLRKRGYIIQTMEKKRRLLRADLSAKCALPVSARIVSDSAKNDEDERTNRESRAQKSYSAISNTPINSNTLENIEEKIEENIDKNSACARERPMVGWQIRPRCTYEEAIEYARAMGYFINELECVDHYIRQRWTLDDGTPLKDWRDAIDEWNCKRSKKRV